MDCRVTVTAYPEARYRQWKRNPELRGSEIVSRKGAEGPGVNESMVRSAVDAAYQDARHAISIIVDSYTGAEVANPAHLSKLRSDVSDVLDKIADEAHRAIRTLPQPPLPPNPRP